MTGQYLSHRNHAFGTLPVTLLIFLNRRLNGVRNSLIWPAMFHLLGIARTQMCKLLRCLGCLSSTWAHPTKETYEWTKRCNRDTSSFS